MVIPTFHYADAPAAIDFLERAFGFERHAVYEGEGGLVAHAEIKAAGGWLMLGSSRPDSPYDIGRQSVYVVIESDVDAHCERARAAGAVRVDIALDHDVDRLATRTASGRVRPAPTFSASRPTRT